MAAQTFDDFEVILVDHRYALRHARVREEARNRGIRLVHTPEHRRNGKWGTIGAAWNTAFALADGEWFLMIPDYTFVPSGWIERHLARLTSKSIYTVAPYRYLALPELGIKRPHAFAGAQDDVAAMTESNAVLDGEIFEEFSAFLGPFGREMLATLKPSGFPHQDIRELRAGKETPPDWVHVKNEGTQRDLVFRLNGLDERLDRGKGPLDTDWGIRLAAAGARLTWAPEAIVDVPNPRWFAPTMPFGQRGERVAGRWSYYDGCAYNHRRTAESALGDVAAKNPWALKDLREALVERGWRDQDKDIDVDRFETDDRSYWGGEIWPESP